jgi:recombination protein RecA
MRKRSNEKREARQRERGLAAAAKAFDGFRPATEVLRKVRAVPTQFIQFDHATRVHGFPIERFTLLHGPSNEGKTLWALGLVASFLRKEHFVLFVDAERTTPIDWVQNLLGPLHSHPGFYAIRPDNYEDTIGQVRRFLNTVAKVREEGTVPKDTSAIVVVDSLKKLVPKDLMKEILEEVKKPAEITAGRDRKGQIQAKMNAAWMDELVPLLEHAQAGFVAIAREMVDPDNTDQWAKKAGTNYKVGGGGAIFYDASLVVRVERDGWISHKAGDEAPRVVYGERHKVTVRKTKIGGKEGRETICYFHSSNGVLIPEGFDRARDVLELGVKFGVVEQAGNWFSFEGERLGAGIHGVVKGLTEHPELLSSIERSVRDQFRKIDPMDYDPETGEVL